MKMLVVESKTKTLTAISVDKIITLELCFDNNSKQYTRITHEVGKSYSSVSTYHNFEDLLKQIETE